MRFKEQSTRAEKREGIPAVISHHTFGVVLVGNVLGGDGLEVPAPLLMVREGGHHGVLDDLWGGGMVSMCTRLVKRGAKHSKR